MKFEFKANQRQALEFILRNKRSGLFMPTGCGKTIVSLLYLQILDRPALIIAPASLKQIWLQENEKFELNLPISIDYKNPAKITVVSYDWIKNYPEILKDFDVIVIDEAHCIANVETVRYQKLLENIKSRDRVILLSGYPVENRLSEIYVVSLISEVLGKNWFSFLYKYFTVIKKRNRIIKTIPKLGSVDKIIEAIRPFVFVADKEKFFDVPIKKEIKIIRYELSDYQKDIINSLCEHLSYKDDKIKISCKNELVTFGKIMQIVSGFIYEIDDFRELNPKHFGENPKLKLLESIIKNRRDFLLWYLFNAEKGILEKYHRYCRLSKLQTDSRGLNLQHYKFAVYYSIPISGGQFLQSVDRLDRIGRVDDVLSIILLPNGEFGNKLFKMTSDKHNLTKRFIRDLLSAGV